MPPAYQLLDVAERTIKQAIETGGLYKDTDALAATREIGAQLATVIANYARGPKGAQMEAPRASTDSLDDDDIDEESGGEEGMDADT